MQNEQKQMKNAQSLQNWQFQSLIFQKLSNLVPGCSKKLEKVTKGPFKSKSYIISPLVQSFAKCQV